MKKINPIKCPVCNGDVYLLKTVSNTTTNSDEKDYNKATYQCRTCFYEHINIVEYPKTPILKEIKFGD